MAFRIPAPFDLLCLVKKLTVIGIIGNTQGVNKAAKPEKNAIMKIDQSPISSSESSEIELDCVGFSITFCVVTSVVSTIIFVVSIGISATFAAV